MSLRTIRCVNGEVQVSLECEPVFEYGALRGTWRYAGEDYHETVVTADGCELELRLVSDMNLGIVGPMTIARHLMKEGETVFCALSWSEHAAPGGERNWDYRYS